MRYVAFVLFYLSMVLILFESVHLHARYANVRISVVVMHVAAQGVRSFDLFWTTRWIVPLWGDFSLRGFARFLFLCAICFLLKIQSKFSFCFQAVQDVPDIRANFLRIYFLFFESVEIYVSIYEQGLMEEILLFFLLLSQGSSFWVMILESLTSSLFSFQPLFYQQFTFTSSQKLRF